MNNFFSYLRLLLLATSGMLLLCIIFAMNPELADGAVRKNLLVSFHISIVSRWGSTYGIHNKEKPFYLFITGCLIITSVRYRIGFLRQRRESSAGTFPFHRSAGCSLVYAQRCFTGASGITTVFHYDHHIYRNRSGHLGDQPYHQSCSHHPSCLQAA